MRFVIAAFTLLSMSGMSWADNGATRFKIENGRIIVAQSHCAMCFNTATACCLGCTARGHAFKHAMTCCASVARKIAEQRGVGELQRWRKPKSLS